ncbi:predicted protein [Arabidopsis lyrata subsp. lyrata]|uniref:Predicted protein n=1 Tax=Arabidopsis lyrata subsp. lyrata TaxID=81972 RepID=D7MJ23_ARALL|nr:predicted protein [Arabidopsis lyrata subsp. lyrata]
MASSSKEVNLFGKRNPDDDDLETKPVLKKHKEEKEKTTEGLADSLQHKSDQANLISLKEEETVEGLDDTPDFVEALEKKNGEYLLHRKIILNVAKIASSLPLPKYEDCLRRGEDETPPDFAEEVLFVANLSPQTKILDIFDFCKDVGEVVSARLIANHEGKHVGCAFVEFLSANEANKVLEKKNGEYLHNHKIFLMKGHGETPDFAEHVRLIVNHNGKHVGWGFVEFASNDEAEKALEKKNGEYLQDGKIFLEAAKIAPFPPPKYEDYLRQESLQIDEDGAVEGLAETPYFVEVREARKKTLFVANLPPQTNIPKIMYFFKDVGEVVRVRLIVDHRGKHVGCGYFEFASANEAEKALEQKNGKSLRYHHIFLDVAEIAPYPLQPKYNLVEKLWYEDNLLREPNLKQQKEKSDGFCGKKTTFSSGDDC